MKQQDVIKYIFAMVPGQPIGEEFLAFLQTGLHKYFFEDKNLKEAFGFERNDGKASYLRTVRNYNLKQAGRHISGKTITARAKALEKEINQFEAIIWQKWKDRDLPPSDCSMLRYHLFWAKKTGITLPGERQLIRDVL